MNCPMGMVSAVVVMRPELSLMHGGRGGVGGCYTPDSVLFLSAPWDLRRRGHAWLLAINLQG